jgi:outer membrane murein-binding lipoprotein Lpp
MKITFGILFSTLLLSACASHAKVDSAGLEKYPQCYHINPKLSKVCIEKNDAGEHVTAVQLENTAYPGQYQ